MNEGAPAWDRFAHWPAARARLALLALALMLLAAALAPIGAGKSTVKTRSFVENVVGGGKPGVERPRDDDLRPLDAHPPGLRQSLAREHADAFERDDSRHGEDSFSDSFLESYHQSFSATVEP